MAVLWPNHLVVGEYLPTHSLSVAQVHQSIESQRSFVWLAESKKNRWASDLLISSADARNQISNWIAPEKPASEIEQLPRPFAPTSRPWKSFSQVQKGPLATHQIAMRKRQPVTRNVSRMKALMQNTPPRSTKSKPASRVPSQSCRALTLPPVFRCSAPLAEISTATFRRA